MVSEMGCHRKRGTEVMVVGSSGYARKDTQQTRTKQKKWGKLVDLPLELWGKYIVVRQTHHEWREARLESSCDTLFVWMIFLFAVGHHLQYVSEPLNTALLVSVLVSQRCSGGDFRG